ncbi:50S ribosomal protein L25/general stress protein Ctc [Nocardia sp. 348MFTsu5.1]|uniref:50S ribosomal protein L25/general stress protein Ctc n=1 Tax=Nocardia sp. 348MFTsu5.1 TaxID=1172185 RepID=UPI000377FFD1|nr:50S ribosomal protein L25/general stress protein Ctc [Nocardia sp. 348MFTsu5.1]
MATANVASTLAVTVRTEKGKGAARRARRAGNVPAVLYGHGADPQHLSVPAREFAAILRNNGLNAIIELDIEGEKQLALPKQVDVHPIRNYIEHTDFVIIRKGEKVTVEVAILVEGEAVSGSLVTNDASVIEIEADALSIPEHLTVSVEGAQTGTTITAGDIELPEGVTLISDPETLIVAINEAQKADTESDTDAPAESAEEAPAAE